MGEDAKIDGRLVSPVSVKGFYFLITMRMSSCLDVEGMSSTLPMFL